MSIENIILLSNVYTESINSDFSYGDKKRGAGYYKNNDGLHTVVFNFDNFVGSVKLQGTLELYPGENDWVDISYDSITIPVDALDSTPVVGTSVASFRGKFLWIRAAYNIQNGGITEIRYNC